MQEQMYNIIPENPPSDYVSFKSPVDTPISKAVRNTVVRVPLASLRSLAVVIHCR